MTTQTLQEQFLQSNSEQTSEIFNNPLSPPCIPPNPGFRDLPAKSKFLAVKLPRLAALVIVILIFGERAEGAVIFEVTDFSASGNEFTEIFSAGDLTGELTGVEVDLVITGGANETWGDDFTILASSNSGLKLQAGGFSDKEADERLSWANGSSGGDGTTIIDSQNLAILLSASQLSISIGNGYDSGGNGTWNGTLTLLGVSEGAPVPEPSPLASFGIFVAGLLGSRRRK